jgi:hypothetical protein
MTTGYAPMESGAIVAVSKTDSRSLGKLSYDAVHLRPSAST